MLSFAACQIRRTQSIQPHQVPALLQAGADGAIVGSALVRIVGDHLAAPEEAPYYLKKYISALKQASKPNPR